MNDLQFQKQLQINPFDLDESMLNYLEQHPELKASVKKARDFEQQIEQAFDVDIPEGLEARILMNQSYEMSKESDLDSHLDDQKVASHSIGLAATKVLPWWGLGGIAASLLVVTISFNLWQAPAGLAPVKATDYIAHIVDHIGHEPELMTAYKVPKNEQDLQKLFLAVGASLEQPIAEMSYAGECVLNGQTGLHIVMQDVDGPVTVIVMPGQQLAAMEAFEASGYQGELMPVKGGVVAIIANNLEQLALTHMRFFKSVKFV